MKLKSDLILIKFSYLLTPSQSVSHKRFHQCVNHKKKLSLRHPLPTFGSFSFFKASLWLGVDKILKKLTKSYKGEHRHLFQCCILIPMKCPRKTPFQHTVPPTVLQGGAKVVFRKLVFDIYQLQLAKSLLKHGFSPIITKYPKGPMSHHIWRLCWSK